MLIRCPECGWKISKEAADCPNCGSPVHFILAIVRLRRMANRWLLYSGFVMLFGLAIAAGDWLSVAIFKVSSIGLSLLLLGFLGLVASVASRQ